MNAKKGFLFPLLAALWCAAGFAFSAGATLTEYRQLPNDRVLLLNDDTNEVWEVRNQAYNKTTQPSDDGSITNNSAFYWTHKGPAKSTAQQTVGQLQINTGTQHDYYEVSYGPEGERNMLRHLWSLYNCRVGSAATRAPGASGTPIATSRNWVPYNKETGISVTSTKLTAALGFKWAGMIMLQNTTASTITSPYYTGGIGTIYFDAVNAWTTCTKNGICVEIATNAVPGAVFEETDTFANYAWTRVPFNVYKVFRLNDTSSINITSPAVSVNEFELAQYEDDGVANAGHTFYRIVAQVNYRGPARFRIRRTTTHPTDTSADAMAYIVVDNVICSYPANDVAFRPKGAYERPEDGGPEGKDTVGQAGMFETPFAGVGAEDMKARASVIVSDNEATASMGGVTGADFELDDITFTYRWRYLQQQVDDWQTASMTLSADGSNIVADTGLDLDKTGDLEYYFSALVKKAPHFVPFDFVYHADPATAWGGFSEDPALNPFVMTSRRADVLSSTIDATGGTDWFTRIREGESDFASMQATARIIGRQNYRIVTNETVCAMELTGDHTWRAYVRTLPSDAGKTLSFRIDGVKWVQTGRTGDDEWAREPYYYFSDRKADEALPWRGETEVARCLVPPSAGKGWGAVALAGASNYVLLELNDETGSLTVYRADYQNFNMWANAALDDGQFIGCSANTNDAKMAGVSFDNKAYVTDYSSDTDWPRSYSENKEAWEEHFEYPSVAAANLGTFFTSGTTLNGWTANNAMNVCPQWDVDAYTNKYPTVMPEIALQLEGNGKGSVALTSPVKEMNGFGTFSLYARLAQSLGFDSFAYRYRRPEFDENYCFSAKISMSEMYKGADLSEGSPSVSLVTYYSGEGCYELRLTRALSDSVSVELYKWQSNGTKIVPTKLRTGSMSNLLVPTVTNMNISVTDRKNWTTAFILAVKNTGTGATMVRAGVAGAPSEGGLTNEYMKITGKTSGVYLEYDDASNPLGYGNPGIGSKECSALIGQLQDWEVRWTAGDGITIDFGQVPVSEESAITSGWWWVPTGRMRGVVYDSGDPDTWLFERWKYGFRTLPVTQTLDLYRSKTGKNKWELWQRMSFDSYVSKIAEFGMYSTDNYDVKLVTGGGADDARVDVIVDDLKPTQWRSDSWVRSNGRKWNDSTWNSWIYTESWIGSGSTKVDDKGLLDITGGTYTRTEDRARGETLYVIQSGTCTIRPNASCQILDMLVVGGGGAGGWTIGGGGGGGGGGGVVMTNGFFLSAEKTYTVKVGEGGDNKATTGNWPRGDNGGNSSFSANDGSFTVTALGGGAGGSWNNSAGVSGGSGGGSVNGNGTVGQGQQPTSASGGYGNAGGRATGDRPGGGGGAGGGGLNGDSGGSARAGDGGAGIASDITGTLTYYGGGGGGGCGNGSRTPGNGGLGGGGMGATYNTNTRGNDGVNGLGGGGGGGGFSGATAGGKGGRGVVIIKVLQMQKTVTLQPMRGLPGYAMGLRSPYVDGMSLFSFTYANADSNCVLHLQIATNNLVGTATQQADSLTDGSPWSDIATWDFRTNTAAQRVGGTLSHYIGLRSPYDGQVRLVMDKEIVNAANNGYSATRPVEVTGGDGGESDGKYDLQPCGKGYFYVAFTNAGSYRVACTENTRLVRVLAVGGGGGGGGAASTGGGGGGGGGAAYTHEWDLDEGAFIAGEAITVTVGAGGAGGNGGLGGNGGTTTIKFPATIDSQVTRNVLGGGGGGYNQSAGAGDGSSVGTGGGSTGGNATRASGALIGGGGAGGRANGSCAGGGGGAGGDGQDGQGSTQTAGAGGDGIASDITGETRYYGGGGGGGGGPGTDTGASLSPYSNTGGAGGAGGGGQGRDYRSNLPAGTGADGFGGGGAGGSWDAQKTGGKGGSGVVILVFTSRDYPHDYGQISISQATIWDNPPIDAWCWWGWNMRTTSDALQAFLPDPAMNPQGFSCALNFKTDGTPEANIKDAATKLSEFQRDDPFIQAPAVTSGVGRVTFRARLYDTNDSYCVISLFAGNNVNDSIDVEHYKDEPKADLGDWMFLTNMVVTSKTFEPFEWRMSGDRPVGNVIRFMVKGGHYPNRQRAVVPADPNDTEGTYIRNRVLLDEILVSESIAPRIGIKNAGVFRYDLKSLDPITNLFDAAQQPLLGENFGVQMELDFALMDEAVNLDGVHAYLAYHSGKTPWGMGAWTNGVYWYELPRANGFCQTNPVFRSSFATAGGFPESVIAPQSRPEGSTDPLWFQYALRIEYMTQDGRQHHVILPAEWDVPDWYYGITDYNAGSRDDPAKFSPYTVLEDISPRRAWVNEANIYDAGEREGRGKTWSRTNQWIEVAVPSGVDVSGWSVKLWELSRSGKVTAQTLFKFGERGVKNEKIDPEYNKYSFIAVQSPETKASKGSNWGYDGYPIDGTWNALPIDGDSSANGALTYKYSYGFQLLRPSGIVEHEVFVGGTNTYWGTYGWSTGRAYDPSYLAGLLRASSGDGSTWFGAGYDTTPGTIGVMTSHGEEGTWVEDLKPTAGSRNRTWDDVEQYIDPDYFQPPFGTNCWIRSYLHGGYLTQCFEGDHPTNISLIVVVPAGTSTNILYEAAPWHRITSFTSNKVELVGTMTDAEKRAKRFAISNIQENITVETTSALSPSLADDYGIDGANKYTPAVVRWLEGLGCESNVVLATLWGRGKTEKICDMTLTEMYWLDMKPFDEQRLYLDVSRSPVALPAPPSTGADVRHPALTNLQISVFMMITNLANGTAWAPYTLQGLGGERSMDGMPASGWTSETFKVTGTLPVQTPGTWAPLRHFAFDEKSFTTPETNPADPYTARVEIYDPFSEQSPAYIHYQWYLLDWEKPLLRLNVNEERWMAPVSILKTNDVFTVLGP